MAKNTGDAEFWKWATSLKPCRYCEQMFVGPVCPCERLLGCFCKDKAK